uniref:NEDD8-activating enzyme E1 regulatory subunit n=1 Tax=Steinernema glaseri TaxID=37863 RepID=A0A1I7YAJ1_9BILA
MSGRYDRQIRLWGDDGQECIQKATVCMLGSSALACEVLKNLVLAGVKFVRLVDSAVVTMPDLGNNFFIEKKHLGEPRAKVTLELLKELNPAVDGDCSLESVNSLEGHQLEQLSTFSLVIGANLLEATAVTVSDYLFPRNVPFIHTRAYGMVGTLRVSVREHTISDAKYEHKQNDLRLDKPFPELVKHVSEIDLDSLTYEQHSHIPFGVLYFKALEKWRAEHGESEADFPDVYKKRKAFERVLMDMQRENEKGVLDEQNFMEAQQNIIRSVQKHTIPEAVQKVLKRCERFYEIDNKEKPTAFWLFALALQKFVLQHGELPVSGVLPDMFSDSKSYTSLLKVYHEKATQDADEVYEYAKEAAQMHLQAPIDDYMTLDRCQQMCKHASSLGLFEGTPIRTDSTVFYKNVLDTIVPTENLEEPPIVLDSKIWYILLQAADRFYMEKRRYPGTNGVPVNMDKSDLNRFLQEIISESHQNETLTKRAAALFPSLASEEICRYGGSELHVIASLMGGVVAQEAIKLVTHQCIPSQGYVYDGHSQQGAAL